MAIVSPKNRRRSSSLRRLWTREEFDRAEERGVFQPDERLELIEGEIIVKELPLKAPHAAAQRRTEKALGRVFAEGYDVRGQLPLALGDFSKPIPDVAVVVGSAEDYEDAHPTSAVLVVEIADASLRFDRTHKAGMYARAGIPEYWILNLNDRILEVYRAPARARGRLFGYAYQSVTLHSENDTAAPLAASASPISVADLLPRRPPVQS